MADDFSQEDPSRIAGFNVFDRVRINFAEMEWYTRDYTQATSPSRRRRRLSRTWARSLAWALLGLLVLSLVLPALVMAFTASTVADTVGNLFIYLLVLPGIAFWCGYPRARRHRGTVVYIVFLVVASLFVGVGLADTWIVGFVALMWLVVYVVMVELFRVTGSGHSFRRTPLLRKSDVEKYTSWGEAGGDVTPATSGTPALALHVSARIMTGQLVTELTRIPGVRVVHLSRTPAAGGADHVVSCGDRMAVLQSQHWRSGDYYWFGPTLVQARPSKAPHGIATSFPDAVLDYRRAFPRLETRGWFVLHSSDGGIIRINNKDANDKPLLSTPESFLREVGEWLAAGDEPTTVNREVLSKLVYGWG